MISILYQTPQYYFQEWPNMFSSHGGLLLLTLSQQSRFSGHFPPCMKHTTEKKTLQSNNSARSQINLRCQHCVKSPTWPKYRTVVKTISKFFDVAIETAEQNNPESPRLCEGRKKPQGKLPVLHKCISAWAIFSAYCLETRKKYITIWGLLNL